MLQIIGWTAASLVVITYFLSVKSQKPLIFHWGNAIGSIVLIPTQIIAGVPFAAFISVSFGLTAILALWKHYNAE